jgi:hypothetical protein
MLIGSETATGSTLQRAFGGGYEIATLWGDELLKIDRILYANWHYDLAMPDKVTLVQFSHFAYIGDFLVVRVARLDFNQDPILIEPHVIAPIGSSPSKVPNDELSQLSFDYRWISNTVCVIADGKYVATHCTVGQRQPFRLEATGDSVSIAFDNQWIQELITSLRNRSHELRSPTE